MLIWKVIDANSGITRDEIFAKIEHQIPAGWARRRYVGQAKVKLGAESLGHNLTLTRARGFVLTAILKDMRASGSVVRNAGCYETLREIKQYRGNPDHVDETGTKAAEHLNAAYAIPKIRAFIARANPNRPLMTRSEFQSLVAYFKPSSGPETKVDP